MYHWNSRRERENRAEELFEEILAKSVTKSMTTHQTSDPIAQRILDRNKHQKHTDTCSHEHIYTRGISHSKC